MVLDNFLCYNLNIIKKKTILEVNMEHDFNENKLRSEWNYSVDETNKMIILQSYKGNSDVVIPTSFLMNNKWYSVKLSINSFPIYTYHKN